MNVTSINPQLIEAFYAEEIGPGMNILRQTQERQSLVFENRDIRAMVKSQMPVHDRAK
jgi:hypothetical protein